MKLFWKVFLLLLITLMITAASSSWLSRKWAEESLEIESRTSTLATLGETAVSIYQDEGLNSYRQWLHHSMRNHRFRGALVNETGAKLLHRQLPPPLQPLLDEIRIQRQQLSIVDPPRLLLARPISRNGSTYYWLVQTHMTKKEMNRGSNQMLLIRLTMALLAIALLSWLLTRMFTNPIRLLEKTTHQLGEGDLQTRTDPAVAGRRDELGELACSIDEMANKLASLIDSHKQLLRDISHELRSPLARLQVALELARNEAGEIAADELDRIGKEAALLNELIAEVLTLARIEQGALTITHQSVQLDQIIEAVIEDAGFEADHCQIHFCSQAACNMMGDALWLARAFDNVIRNAVRHTEKGTTVEIALNSDTERAVIDVHDHGPGVENALLVKLFEPFVRGSEARERTVNSSGYGLGLAIARHVIELHQGTIDARNHPDGGLVVTITLPLQH